MVAFGFFCQLDHNMPWATGKGNYMIACKNIIKSLHVSPRGLALLGMFLYLSSSSAQSDRQSPGEIVSDQESTESRHIERLGEVNADEYELDLALPGAAPVVPATGDVSLPDEAQDQELQRLVSRMAADPGSAKVLAQLNEFLSGVLDQANSLMDIDEVAQAERLLAVIVSIDPNLKGMEATQRRLLAINQARQLMAAGDSALADERVLEPLDNNAFYYFTQALIKDPRSRSAQLGLARVQEALIERANEAAQGLDFEMAGYWLEQAAGIREDQTQVDAAWEQLEAFQSMRGEDLEKQALTAMAVGDYNLAEFAIIDLIALGGEEDRVVVLRAALEDARYYGGLEPGQIISDVFLNSADMAPDVVVIPAGSFLMGSDGGADNEKPRHRVTISRGFGLGVREVSVAEFRLFIERSAYRTAAEKDGRSMIYDESAGRINHRGRIDWEYGYNGKKAKPEMPVVHVNWHDAQAYVQWLSEETGKRYRLPSEAEYEYVARAGGSGTYWWGEKSPDETVENLTGQRDTSPGMRRWTTFFKKYGDGHWGPAPVGTFESNLLIHPMGVYDIAGNVSEWMEDCWHQNYMQAPSNGSAWVNPGCSRRVVRGGYWASAPDQTRAAFRISAKPETSGPVVGIRIARDL